MYRNSATRKPYQKSPVLHQSKTARLHGIMCCGKETGIGVHGMPYCSPFGSSCSGSAEKTYSLSEDPEEPGRQSLPRNACPDCLVCAQCSGEDWGKCICVDCHCDACTQNTDVYHIRRWKSKQATLKRKPDESVGEKKPSENSSAETGSVTSDTSSRAHTTVSRNSACTSVSYTTNDVLEHPEKYGFSGAVQISQELLSTLHKTTGRTRKGVDLEVIETIQDIFQGTIEQGKLVDAACLFDPDDERFIITLKWTNGEATFYTIADPGNPWSVESTGDAQSKKSDAIHKFRSVKSNDLPFTQSKKKLNARQAGMEEEEEEEEIKQKGKQEEVNKLTEKKGEEENGSKNSRARKSSTQRAETGTLVSFNSIVDSKDAERGHLEQRLEQEKKAR